MENITSYESDLRIAQAIIHRDEKVTRQFFYEDCRGMLMNVLKAVFPYPVEYEEAVSELYLYIMENDAFRLRQFQGRSTLFLWLRTTATRFFIKQRDQVIDNTSHETLINGQSEPSEEEDENKDRDITLLQCAYERMPNRRYAYVLQRLVIEEAEAEIVAAELGVTVDNLYNIKKRAINQLTQILTQYGLTKR